MLVTMLPKERGRLSAVADRRYSPTRFPSGFLFTLLLVSLVRAATTTGLERIAESRQQQLLVGLVPLLIIFCWKCAVDTFCFFSPACIDLGCCNEMLNGELMVQLGFLYLRIWNLTVTRIEQRIRFRHLPVSLAMLVRCGSSWRFRQRSQLRRWKLLVSGSCNSSRGRRRRRSGGGLS